jgi:hypothetical protein
MKHIFLTLSLVSFFTFFIHSQSLGFDSQLIAGISAAQIRGDDLAGFNKVGIEAGIGASYEVRYNMDIGIELLYSQRGSRSELSFGTNSDIRTFQLDYLAIPLVFTIKDWLLQEENELSYYRVKAEAGLSYGRLLKSSVEGNLGTIPDISDAFNGNDLSWLLGFGYQINYKLGARLRYNRSIIKVFSTADNPNINYNDLLPFHLSLQLTYKL